MTAVLALNVGSSSLKAAAFVLRGRRPQRILTASHDGSVGETELVVRNDGLTHSLGPPGAHYRDGAAALLNMVERVLGETVAVGHRVVHGGTLSGTSVRLTPELVKKLRSFAPFAPDHQEANLAPAETLMQARPELVQFATFDTSFHETIPDRARELPLPQPTRGPLLKRYGFHGLSFRSVARRMADRDLRRIVALHLGGGASVCAIRDRASVDTTMGATPLAGPMMTTRSGSVDPGVILYLLHQEGCDLDDMEDMLWHRSGLLGVSGQSGDLRDLVGSDDGRAQVAVDQFCEDLVRHTGAMAARLRGIDALVFTGGAGVGQPLIRERVAGAFVWAGVALDAARNDAVTEATILPRGNRVSRPNSAKQVWVLPNDEEREIAREVYDAMRREA
ncbi:acetate kinase [Lutimaribacter pacificus]|uniref:Acetate kinase n=1 Tax=Lutimaribacter pacificus TaxID=391948 RepID=A0A1H0LUT3_9RHOB|nr:acetate/propionate family kinase [Lutimaribacter pacificus]SDO71716.1 acetate kinase [Lutimaribacter pacificus]SHK03223.1 acetate kinase [Lutimaribacter pacificus]